MSKHKTYRKNKPIAGDSRRHIRQTLKAKHLGRKPVLHAPVEPEPQKTLTLPKRINIPSCPEAGETFVYEFEPFECFGSVGRKIGSVRKKKYAIWRSKLGGYVIKLPYELETISSAELDRLITAAKAAPVIQTEYDDTIAIARKTFKRNRRGWN